MATEKWEVPIVVGQDPSFGWGKGYENTEAAVQTAAGNALYDGSARYGTMADQPMAQTPMTGPNQAQAQDAIANTTPLPSLAGTANPEHVTVGDMWSGVTTPIKNGWQNMMRYNLEQTIKANESQINSQDFPFKTAEQQAHLLAQRKKLSAQMAGLPGGGGEGEGGDGTLYIDRTKKTGPQTRPGKHHPKDKTLLSTSEIDNPYANPSLGRVQHGEVQPTNFRPMMGQYKDLLGDVTPGMEERVQERESRLGKREAANGNEQLMQFGLGMLGKKDFYSAVGDSGQAAMQKYTDNKDTHNKARTLIGEKRDAIAMQKQAQQAQAIGYAQKEAGLADAANIANATNNFKADVANLSADVEMAKIGNLWNIAKNRHGREYALAREKLITTSIHKARKEAVGLGGHKQTDVIRNMKTALTSMLDAATVKQLVAEGRLSLNPADETFKVPTQSGLDKSFFDL
jgi:hypothetical protein